MSAFKYLLFVFGIPILAVLGAVLNEFVLPILDIASGQATSAEATTGVQWASSAWTWMPLLVVLMLVFMLLVGIVVRRNRVGGGI